MQISLNLMKTDLQLDVFSSSEVCQSFFISFQSSPCYLGWLQIAALCTARGAGEHCEVDPGTCETLHLPFHSCLYCLHSSSKDRWFRL